jgi:hypothetical protein
MAYSKKISFTVKVPVDPDDRDNKETKEVKLDVRTPDLKQINEAQLAYNRGFDIAMRSKAPLRIEVEALLKDREIWTKVKQDELDKLNTELNTKVNKLLGGGMKLLEARKLAIEIRDQRDKIASLNTERRILDTSTAEAQAEAARFNWFVANCTVYTDTGAPFFSKDGKPDVDTYLEDATSDYAQECARQFGVLQYGLDPEFEKKLPENQFLFKFKFVREKDLRLINRDKHLVDRDFNLIDEEGYLVDKDNNRMDRTGTPLDKEGKPKIETKPFLDDDSGVAIQDSELKVEELAA